MIEAEVTVSKDIQINGINHMEMLPIFLADLKLFSKLYLYALVPVVILDYITENIMLIVMGVRLDCLSVDYCFSWFVITHQCNRVCP